jgi:hypothetical protein
MIILASLIVVPLFVVLAPFVTTGAVLGAASASGSALNDGNRPVSQVSVAAAPVEQVVWQDEAERSLPAMDVAPQERTVQSTNHEIPVRPSEVNQVEKRELRSDAVSQAYDGEFTYKANLVDSRGTIVLQSGPSVLAANVEKLQSGDSVTTAGRSGKWIKVRTSSGLIGYVRQKQLQFQSEQ